MADERQKNPVVNGSKEQRKAGSPKVSYSKTRTAFTNKYKPRHFTDAEAEKTYKQLRLEKTRIRIRKIKRLNIALTLLTIAILFTMFLGAGILIPKSNADVDVQRNSDASLVVDFTGDVMFGRYITQISQNDGYDAVFHGVSPFFQNADLVFVNLESAVLKDETKSYSEADKKIHLYCNYDLIEAAQKAGINVFGVANNHGFDYSDRPVEELIDYFRDNEIYYSGIGKNIDDAAQYTIIDVNGYRVAFIAITDVFYRESCAAPDHAGVLATTYSAYGQLVHDASVNSDITIVYFHWGEENDISRNNEQITLGHRLIDAGADIIIGSHPHVLQEIEKYKDGIIFYSLGNFIFDQGTTFARDSVIVELTVDKNGKPEFTLIPIRINDGAPEVTDSFFYKARINRELTQGLSGSDYYTGDDGYVHVRLGVTYPRTAEEATTAPTTAPATDAAPTEPTQPAESQPATIKDED